MAKASARPACDLCGHKHWKYEPHAWKGPEACGTPTKIGTEEISPTSAAVPDPITCSAQNVGSKSMIAAPSPVQNAEPQKPRAKFDRNEYQKSYMRKYRQRRKAGGTVPPSTSTPS